MLYAIISVTIPADTIILYAKIDLSYLKVPVRYGNSMFSNISISLTCIAILIGFHAYVNELEILQ